MQIADVAVTLRHYKRIGWLLDPEGRATGEVVPIWPSRSVLGDVSTAAGSRTPSSSFRR